MKARTKVMRRDDDQVPGELSPHRDCFESVSERNLPAKYAGTMPVTLMRW